MGHWLERNIIEPGKLPLLLALTAFVLTFLITRVVTRMIRAGKGPFGNVSAGGVHVHHVVPGVVLTVLGGFGAVASTRHGFGSAAFAVVFGIGAGLVLDEFALILHLDDVYWTEAGRKSVEVVVLTAALVGLVLCGFVPFGVNDLDEDELQDRGSVIVSVAVNFVFSLLALAKGKARTAIFGVIVPLIALVGAIRLARPGSPWAKRLYGRRPRARARSTLRAYHHDRRWAGPSRTVQDWIGGRPDEPVRALEHR
ncbi:MULTISPECIES: hypothetical protein [Streptomyces]|uniref:Integral membrane protein n=1 Tax=Streptomyces plumbiresistens TaxID=511811 RepID=A0ABP7RDF6_9ACTN|nr:hypothetical protein [Streptomyces sp. NBC_01373]MCX4701420.1 hypothetical protein [Streptomyces sp. NBC_01373]